MMKNIKHNAAQVAAPSNLSSPGCDRFLRVSRRRKQALRGRWNISLRPSVFGNTNDGVNENEGKKPSVEGKQREGCTGVCELRECFEVPR